MSKSEIIIRIPKFLLEKIKDDLRRPHKFAYERIGFIGSRHKSVATGSIIIFMTEYYPIQDGHYLNDPEVGARINSAAIRDGLQRIIDERIGIFHTHYHILSDRGPKFSKTDLKDNPEIIKSFGYADKNQVHGMLVLGNNGINGLVRLPGEDELRSATKITEVGYPMGVSIPGKRIWNRVEKRYDRQSFLGQGSQFIIEHIRVGIVGLGGGGSHIVQQLAHLGVKEYVLYDFDHVDETNLNRMIGAGLNDVRGRRKKVATAEDLIKRLHQDARIKALDMNWMEAPEYLQECDVVFGCVDSYLARRDLEGECRRYLIPYIDIGMDVHDEYEDEAPNMVGQIILSLPGKPCMHCMGFLTEQNLAKEAAKYGAAGGRPQVVWSNGVLASQAIGVFVDLITGWSGRKEITSYYSFDGNTGELAPHKRLKYINGSCDHYKIQNAGAPKFKPV